MTKVGKEIIFVDYSNNAMSFYGMKGTAALENSAASKWKCTMSERMRREDVSISGSWSSFDLMEESRGHLFPPDAFLPLELVEEKVT